MQKTHFSFNYYRDAGHGWVAVKRNILDIIGIADKISMYSYQRGKMAYLEEDCDASLFMNAFAEKFGKEPKLKIVDHGDYSWVRSQDRFKN